MAGGVLRGFGIFFMVIGVIGLVGGVAVMGFVTAERSDQNELERLGSEASGDADDMDQAFVVGAAAAGVGLILLVVGLVLNATGKSARDRARHEEVLAAAVGQGGDGPAAEPAAPPAAPPEGGGVTGAVPAAAPEGTPDDVDADDADRDQTSGALFTGVVLAVVAVVAVGLALMAAGGIGNDGGTANVAGPDGPLIDTTSFEGHVTATASDGGGGTVNPGASDHEKTMVTPDGTRRVTVELTWTEEEAGGAEQLRLILEGRDDDGDWTRRGDAGGTSPVRLDYRPLPLDGAEIRVRVVPHDAGFTARQPFTVEAAFWAR